MTVYYQNEDKNFQLLQGDCLHVMPYVGIEQLPEFLELSRQRFAEIQQPEVREQFRQRIYRTLKRDELVLAGDRRKSRLHAALCFK